MEKMMYFGLAVIFAMMTAVPPRPVKKPPVPSADYPHIKTKDKGIENQGSLEKPNKIKVQAIYWHSAE